MTDNRLSAIIVGVVVVFFVSLYWGGSPLHDPLVHAIDSSPPCTGHYNANGDCSNGSDER